MSEGKLLPAEFADLEKFRDWIVTTEGERIRRRNAASDEELKAFYDAMLPRMDDVARHLNGFPIDAMPDDARRLFDLAKSFMEIALIVERGRSLVAWRFDVNRFRPMHERSA